MQRSQAARIENGFHRIDNAVHDIGLQSMLEQHRLEGGVTGHNTSRHL